jgi:hypothetical protein
MTWVCHKTGIKRNEVYAGEETTPVPGPMGDRTKVGSLEEWVTEQKPSLVAEASLMKEWNTVTQDSGLTMIIGSDDIAQIYVPATRREKLIELHHLSINHLAAAKTYSSMQRHCTWPSMKRDVRSYCDACKTGELSKARRNVSSGTWRAVQASPPRSRGGRIGMALAQEIYSK